MNTIQIRTFALITSHPISSLFLLFSSIVGKKFKFDAMASQDIEVSSQYTYYVRFCGRVQAPSKCASLQTSVCGTQTWSETPTNLGYWQGVQMQPLDAARPEAGVQFYFNNGSPPYEATIKFICSRTRMAKTDASSVSPTMEIFDPAACPVEEDEEGLSGGSIFLIILVVVIPIYIAGGCLYNYNKKGTPFGCASCPNHDSWCKFLELTKAGCVFSFNKARSLCGGRSTGGSAGGADTYGSVDI